MGCPIGAGGVPLALGVSRWHWECPVGIRKCEVWLCTMPVVIEVGGKVRFLRMIAGGLIFRYRRPDLGGVHRV